MSEASSKWVLQRTWSIGDIVPSLAPLFWILTILIKLERRITDIVPAIVLTVAGPFPILSWSKLFITRSLNGPIFTNKRKAIAPSAKSTKNNNWIIFFLPYKKYPLHWNCQKSLLFPNRTEIAKNPYFFQMEFCQEMKSTTPQTNSLFNTKASLEFKLVERRTLFRTHSNRPFLGFHWNGTSTEWPKWNIERRNDI